MKTAIQAQMAKSKNAKQLIVEPEFEPLLAEVEAIFASMGRKDTDQPFLRGEHLARVKAVVPEGTYEKWVKARCGFTTRLARLSVAIHQNLQPHRERLVSAGVVPTVLYVLSSAEPAQIEEVLAVFESGKRMTVGQVKRKVKVETETSIKEPVGLGGAAGLRRAGEARMKADLAIFDKLVKRSLKAVELIAADIRKGKHVPKTRLATDVEAYCQKAGILLSGVISPRGSDAPLSAEWEKARRVVARLGDSPRYPGRDEFADWVVDTVLPALRFVVLGEAFPGSASATIDVAVNSGGDIAEVAEEQVVDDGGSTPASAGEGEHVGDAPDEGSDAAAAVPTPRKARFVVAPPLVPDDAIAPITEVTLEGATGDE